MVVHEGVTFFGSEVPPTGRLTKQQQIEAYTRACQEEFEKLLGKAKDYLAQTGQPFPVEEQRASIASIAGVISQPQFEDLAAQGLITIIPDPGVQGTR